MTVRQASCHCGDLVLECAGDPIKVSMCHCRDCQRRTGSAFSVAVFYPRGNVRIEGATAAFARASASGHPVIFHFCPRCGSNILWYPDRLPHLVGVALGAFADPEFPAAAQSVWTRDKHHWLDLPEAMERFDVNPPPRPA